MRHVTSQLPEVFKERMQRSLGAEYEAFLGALDGDPVVSLRFNTGKSGAAIEGTDPIPWAENGVYLPARPRFFRDPFIYAGGLQPARVRPSSLSSHFALQEGVPIARAGASA